MRRGYKFPLLRAALSAIAPPARAETKNQKTIQLELNDGSIVDVDVPKSIVTQVTKLREVGIPADDIVTTVAQGEWARPLAKAFCLSEERFRLPDDMLSDEERACIDSVSIRLAKELLGAG